MINHWISNLISRIRNTIPSSGLIIHQKDVYHSKEILNLLAKLGELGYVQFNTLTQTWTWISSSSIKAISTPGKRIFRKSHKLAANEIVRTSAGYKTGIEAGKERKGGELILKIGRKGGRGGLGPNPKITRALVTQW